ncbi:hypothetical protein [Pararhizobium sp. A13]|uniref:hypothetical protein n=1 Tax=Pararhizobium sp. A13 TaxID=3133975 RepID=UPI00311AD95E
MKKLIRPPVSLFLSLGGVATTQTATVVVPARSGPMQFRRTEDDSGSACKLPGAFDIDWRRHAGAGTIFLNLIHDVDNCA